MVTRRMNWLVAAVVVLASLPALAQESERVRYDDYKVVSVALQDEAQLEQLRALGLDLLSEAAPLHDRHYLVSPEEWEQLTALGFDVTILNDNIQELIDAEQARIAANSVRRDITWFEEYKTLPEIYTYLDGLIADFPALISKAQVGQSVEGRPVYLYTIEGTGGAAEKPAIFYNGMLHSREWISPMTVAYVMDQLVRNYGSDAEVTSVLDRVRFYIMPVANPDGYLYSWSTERLWRKNRRDNGNGTFGVDLNRNFAFGWGTAGSSGFSSSDTYRGPSPFSEPESQNVRDVTLGNDDIVAHIDFHSYSQLVLRPYGVEGQLPPPAADDALMTEAGDGMAAAIFDVNGEVYVSQPAIELYAAGGTCADWHYGGAGVFSWTIELRDTGTFGFLLPADQIIPTAEENFAAVLYMADFFAAPFKLQFESVRPTVIEADEVTAVAVDVLSISDDYAAGTGQLFYRFGESGPFTSALLSEPGAGELVANLPATPCGGQLQWYISAESTDGRAVTLPADAPTSVFVADAFEITTVADDTFEADSGWTVGAPGDDATTGLWNRMDPQPTAAQPGSDVTPGAGTDCWITDGRAGSSVGTYDVDNGKTTLVSPVFDLSGMNDPVVSYWRWYNNTAGSSPNSDVFRIEITGDGANWTLAEQVGPSGPQTSGGWFYYEFKAADFVALTADVQVRFVAADEGAGSIVEAAIDDFAIIDTGCSAPACGEDITGDGLVDGADLNILLSNWSCDGDCPAGVDLSGDGLVDGADLNLLLSAWGPCP